MARNARLPPRELVKGWPEVQSDDPVGEVARQLALNLRNAIGERTLRAAEEATGVDHSTIGGILQGATWPDIYTLAKLELGLDADLWPKRGKNP